MNVAVIFATKTGCTREAAQMLADKLRARGATVELYELGRDDPALSADAYVIGGSVRIGQWHKLARAFVAAHADELSQKPVTIFACRCGTDDTRALLAPQIGERLAQTAAWIGSLGGRMDLAQQRGLDRLVAKMVSKSPMGESFQPRGLLDDQADALVGALLSAADPSAQP